MCIDFLHGLKSRADLAVASQRSQTCSGGQSHQKAVILFIVLARLTPEAGQEALGTVLVPCSFRKYHSLGSLMVASLVGDRQLKQLHNFMDNLQEDSQSPLLNDRNEGEG